MEMSEEEYYEAITRKRGPKNFKVSGSWGTDDARRAIRKKGWEGIGKPVKDRLFFTIIRRVNQLLARNISDGIDVVFPKRMGKLMLMRKEADPVIKKDGTLKVCNPIDWRSTIRLWYEDEEAREKKMLVRRPNSRVYFVKYDKRKANFGNKQFYQFTLNRYIRLGLKEKITNRETDTIW